MMEQVKTMATKYATEKTAGALMGAGIAVLVTAAYYDRKRILGAGRSMVSWAVQKAKRTKKAKDQTKNLSVVEDPKEV